MDAEHLNGLIAAYAAGPPVLDWARPLAWQSWPERADWLTAPIPPEVGTIGAYEYGRVFKRAGLDYLMSEEHGVATAIRGGPAALGWPDAESARRASDAEATRPGVYRLDDGSWAAALDDEIDTDGRRQYRARLRDGRIVRRSHDAPGMWRVQVRP